MNLRDIYETEGASGLARLAAATGANPQYLYQCATGRKEPSPRLARALIKADRRITLDALYLRDQKEAFTVRMQPDQIIDKLGGTKATADLCKVSQPAVSQWRRAGIPAAREMYLRAVRPDVFELSPTESGAIEQEAA